MSLWPNQVLPGDRPGEASGGNESDLVCPGKKFKNHRICKTKKTKLGKQNELEVHIQMGSFQNQQKPCNSFFIQ